MESDVQPTLILAVVFPLGAQAIEPLVMISQLAASYFACWQSSRLAADLEWEAKTAAAILDLVGKIHEAADLTSACHTLAAELQTCLGCDRVAIGLRRGESGPCRLVAVSGIAELRPAL